MDIDFAKKKERRVFNNVKLLIRTYGPENARRIRLRVLEFNTARFLADIPETPPPRRHKLTNRKEEYAVDVKHPFRLVFTPDPASPKSADGAYDISEVTGIIILRVEDYHGN
ncbi:hypothetical protein [Eggerthella sp. YY7918]|uniref:hypothetical protein n=1 Tax=Eggerthella sp. (strain YY7918) TaxID=502558 RepID=UPI00021710B4|nr:hypothetical protein [Eggerthella sp. YY7918]BAK43481.1 transglutaminase-like enzyme [Eggerthella sp. YY7918]